MLKSALLVSLCCALVALSAANYASILARHMRAGGRTQRPTMSLRQRSYISAQKRNAMLQAIQRRRQQLRTTANPYNRATQRVASTPLTAAKANPYSTIKKQRISALLAPKTNSYSSVNRPQNSVYSPANRISRPVNALSKAPSPTPPSINPYSAATTARAARTPSPTHSRGNPYSARTQATKSNSSGNPYSTSRAGSSTNPAVRGKYTMRQRMMIARQRMARLKAMKAAKTAKAMKAIVDQPKKAMEAKGMGCTNLAPDNPMAMVMMMGTCKSPMVRMACQSEFLSCMMVGTSPMCCPLGMNKQTYNMMKTMKQMQQFMEM